MILFEHTKPRKGCIWLVFTGLLVTLAGLFELARTVLA